MDTVVLNKAYKFLLLPTKEQNALFTQTFGCVRFVYNKMLGDRIAIYETHKKNEKMLKQQKLLTPATYKKEHSFLKLVDSLSLANAQQNLNRAFTNFFKGNAKFPKFKSKKKSRSSYTTNNQQGSIRLEKKYIKLPKVGWVKIKQHRQMKKGSKIKSATISRTSSGKIKVAILVEYEQKVKEQQINESVGLDFAMRDFYVSSDDEKANYPRYYRKMQEKLAKEQKKLSRQKLNSNRYKKQSIRVAKLHEKVCNQRKDFLHKLSFRLSETYDAVFVEDIDMRNMSQALRFGKSVSDNGFGMFRDFLKYKLEERGKNFIKIDKWFPSSKTCSSCDHKKVSLLLSERTYHCDNCGHSIDRDLNAAHNIKKEGLRLLGL